MGILSKIKADAQKSSNNRSKFIYVKDGEKKRIRFLQDMEEGWEVPFHDSYEASINVPCQELFGRECRYCGDEGLRTRSQYAWCVWDYDASEVRIFMYAMNQCTPIPSVAAMYETFGTLKDRDYVISRAGKQQSTSYTVIPMDKEKLRNSKAKALSYEAFLKILDEAYPDENAEKKDKPAKKASSKPKKAVEEEEDEEDMQDYSKLSAKELYKLCEKREVECEPKMPAKYYINLLEEDDAAHDDWDDDAMNEPEDDDEEWED